MHEIVADAFGCLGQRSGHGYGAAGGGRHDGSHAPRRRPGRPGRATHHPRLLALAPAPVAARAARLPCCIPPAWRPPPPAARSGGAVYPDIEQRRRHVELVGNASAILADAFRHFGQRRGDGFRAAGCGKHGGGHVHGYHHGDRGRRYAFLGLGCPDIHRGSRAATAAAHANGRQLQQYRPMAGQLQPAADLQSQRRPGAVQRHSVARRLAPADCAQPGLHRSAVYSESAGRHCRQHRPPTVRG